MRSNPLLGGSAAAYFVVAVACIFAGGEILEAAGAARTRFEVALIQLAGAAWLGFAMLNWMSRYSTIGGIYGRPLVVANLAWNMTAALMMLQLLRREGAFTVAAATLVLQGALAVAFGAALFGEPRQPGK